MISPLEFYLENDKPVVRYTSPTRKFGNLREEMNIDAVKCYKEHGPCYLGFSSGIDCQIILRSWLDMNCEIHPFFVHTTNDSELEAVKHAEKFYGIKIKIISIDVNQRRQEYERMMREDNFPSMIDYPFYTASTMLEEQFPVVLSGPSEPCPIGLHEYYGASIYHNTESVMILRCKLLEKTRKVIDFPYSSESLASYYCDDIMKAYVDSSRYFIFNELKKDNEDLAATVRYEYYCKPLIKAHYYKRDIFYPSKKNGAENHPDWMLPNWQYPEKYRVSAPYLEVVEHLEKCDGSTKEYRDWIYP